MTEWTDRYIPEPNSGCWLWLGSVDKDGYGKLKINGWDCRAHRLAYEDGHGFIPDGMFVCHTCDVPSCVNPSHLFLGSALDNNRDAKKKKRHYVPPTHCIYGHLLDDANVYRWKNKRFCLTCRRERDNTRYAQGLR